MHRPMQPLGSLACVIVWVLSSSAATWLALSAVEWSPTRRAFPRLPVESIAFKDGAADFQPRRKLAEGSDPGRRYGGWNGATFG